MGTRGARDVSTECVDVVLCMIVDTIYGDRPLTVVQWIVTLTPQAFPCEDVVVVANEA